MNAAVWEYVKRFAQLGSDSQLTRDAYWAAAQALAQEAVQHLGDDAPMLFGPLSRLNRLVYACVAIALEQLATMPEPLSAGSRNVSLALLPVTVLYRAGEAIPRTIGVHEWAPPLPDRRNVPGLLDFLLTWEEVTTPSVMHHLLDVLGHVGLGLGHHVPERLLRDQLGDAPNPSRFDSFNYEEGPDRYSALRFAPALIRSTEQPWFSDFSERKTWQQQAFQRIEQLHPNRLWPYPQSPVPFTMALAVGESQLVCAWLDRLFEAAQSEGLGTEEMPLDKTFMLIEGLGDHLSQLATGYRFSILERDTHSGLALGAYFLPIQREHAFWEETAKKLSDIASERFGLATVVAPLVQEVDVWLVDAEPTKRLLVVFGPMTGLDTPVPDGFPLQSHPRASDEYTKWWFYERQGEESNIQVVNNALAEALQLNPESFRVRGGVALWGSRWRPAFVTDLEDAITAADMPLPWPPEEILVEHLRETIGNAAARAWVDIKHSSASQGDREGG